MRTLRIGAATLLALTLTTLTVPASAAPVTPARLTITSVSADGVHRYQVHASLHYRVNVATASGRVTFYDGASVLGTGLRGGLSTVNGVETDSYTVVVTLASGLHQLHAAFAGDVHYVKATSPVFAFRVPVSVTTPTTIMLP